MLDLLETLLFIIACGVGGWFVFLFIAAGITGHNPFQKSEDMEADNQTRAAGEDARRIEHLYRHWNNYDDAAHAELEAMRKKDNARYMKAAGEVHEQQNAETAESLGCGCLMAPLVIGALWFAVWFPSRYPSFDSIRVLLGW